MCTSLVTGVFRETGFFSNVTRYYGRSMQRSWVQIPPQFEVFGLRPFTRNTSRKSFLKNISIFFITECWVTFYQHRDFGGYADTYTDSSTPRLRRDNDMSSLRIKSGEINNFSLFWAGRGVKVFQKIS